MPRTYSVAFVAGLFVAGIVAAVARGWTYTDTITWHVNRATRQLREGV